MKSNSKVREQRRQIVVAYLENQTDAQWKKLQMAVLNTTRILHVLRSTKHYLEGILLPTTVPAQQTHKLVTQLMAELAANDFRWVTLAEIERQTILSAVARANGNVLRAAINLGIGKTTLYRKLRDYQTPVRAYSTRKGRPRKTGGRKRKS